VRDRVARIRKQLPATIDEPVVSKDRGGRAGHHLDRRLPRSPVADGITDFADRYLTDPLKALPGVSSVIIGGERKYAMRVWLDRERLPRRGLQSRTSKTR